MDSISTGLEACVPTAAEVLAQRIASRTATVGVIGLGYVGLPLAAAVGRAGFATIGFDVNPRRIEHLNGGRSHVDAVSDDELARLLAAGTLTATDDLRQFARCDILVICVPTPLTPHREPDLSFIEATARGIARHLRPGQMVVLESTTYPGTTDEVLRPILEAGGLCSGTDFFLGYSPEREDPGNRAYRTVNIPKVVAGDGPRAASLVETFFQAVVERVVRVSSLEVAEAVKLTENVFRAVNIALVNELKLIYEAMGLDIWEILEAAGTKPFGYMPFHPGPGIGGHCIPIDPVYLAWKAQRHGLASRMTALAGEINAAMPRHVLARLERELDGRFQLSLASARILIVGLAYKRNVSDIRESPALKLMALLAECGTRVDVHDPHVEEAPGSCEGAGACRRSVPLDAAALARADAVVIATDHDAIDYGLIARRARLVVDTRNVMARHGLSGGNVVNA